MKLFVGLGNPGGKYAKTRHNIGFMAVDAIGDGRGFSPERAKFQSAMREGRIGSEKVVLLKPQTFMNLSGQAVGEAMRFFRLDPEDVVVFHDELDLAPGRLKVKLGGGHAGHNGLRSLHEHIGAQYHRVRMGIGHPGDKRQVSGYVLHDFAKADWTWIEPLLDGVEFGAEHLVAGDMSGFTTKVALKTQPPKHDAGSKSRGDNDDKRTDMASKARPTAETSSSAGDPATAKPSPGERAASNPFAQLVRKLRGDRN